MTCNLQAIQYGSVNFSTVPVKSRLSFVPMYADDGITTKYYKAFIDVEFVVAVSQAYTDINGHTSADDYIDNIKTVLTTPGLALSYSYRGFGKSFQCSASDVVYGPYPRVLEWEPLGSNQAVKVVWRVEFATVRCPVTTTPSSNTYSRFQVVQLVEDMVLSYEEDGMTVIQTNGTLEVALDGTNKAVLTPENLKKFLAFYIPNALNNFERKIQASLRKDKRTVDYRITDTEIKSDNPYHPYIVRQSAEHEMSSSVMSSDPFAGAGFKTWLNNLSGSFSVRPGEWKGWGYIAFLSIIAQRRSRSALGAFDKARQALDGNDNPEAGNDGNAARAARKNIRPFQIPLFMSLKEEIYGREVSFNHRWITSTTIDNILASTGMFYPVNATFIGMPNQQTPVLGVNTPDRKETQWATRFTTAVQPLQKVGGYRQATLPGFNLVFDTCDTPVDPYTHIQQQASALRQNTFLGETIVEFDSGWTYYQASEVLGTYNSNPGGTTATTSSYLKGLTKDNSWIKYSNKFELVEETNAAYVPTLDARTVSSLNTSDAAYSNRDKEGFRVNKGTQDADAASYADDVIQTFW